MSDSRLNRVVGLVSETLATRAKRVTSSLRPEPTRVSRGETKFTPPAPPPPLAADAEALDGWGFADTKFVVNAAGNVVLTGSRYNISNVELPNLLPWLAQTIASPLAPDNQHPPHYPPRIPAAKTDAALLSALQAVLAPDQITDDAKERLRRGHGHTGAEIWAIRYGHIERVPDLVVYPTSHEEVQKIVEIGQQHSVCLVPFGGGTNVTEALRLPANEGRLVIALDMRRMNRVLWVDAVNRTACIEAGATGRHLMAELAKYGLTMGHEPDSLEFSTLGGWVATNASGMKKNRYGNIEDLVLDVQVVTHFGTVSRPHVGPRESIGMNPKNLFLGSEGNLGIITAVTVKLFPLPEVQKYGSVLFPDLERGLAFLYELQRAGAVPASVRVMDNTQFHFGQALKPATTGTAAKYKSEAEKLFVTKVKGFDPHKMAVATIVFEGSADEVAYQENVLYRIAESQGGMKAGATNGERGYQLTFGIAYIRDLAFTHHTIAESFETSVPWSHALDLYDRVKARVAEEHERLGLPGKPFFTGRITQVYATGVAMYFYMGFYCKGVENPVAKYGALEHAAREAILAAGGTLSHHHGVGKIRQDFLPEIYSQASRAVTAEVKGAIDPHNLFGTSNHGVHGLVKLES